MKSCARCNQKAKSKILTACGLIRLCRHCRLAWWAMLCVDELTEVLREAT